MMLVTIRREDMSFSAYIHRAVSKNTNALVTASVFPHEKEGLCSITIKFESEIFECSDRSAAQSHPGITHGIFRHLQQLCMKVNERGRGTWATIFPIPSHTKIDHRA